jgi:palmitoyltransferase ZDHHC9/14/18
MSTPNSARKRPKQLPLPSASLSNAPLPTNPPSTPTRTSVVQVGRNSGNFSVALSPPRSPTFSTHARMHNSHSTPSHVRSQSFSSTHAGGVLPSASFFHPSRPSQRLSEEDMEYEERPSEYALLEVNETELDNIHLQPIRPSEDEGGLSAEEGTTNIADTSNKSGDLIVSSELSGSALPQPSMSDPTRRLRNSIDRLRQGISFDSPGSTHINLPTENKNSSSEDPDENKRYSAHMEPSHIPRSPSLTSQAPSFAPTVPEDPVWAVPITKGKRRVLNYEGYPSRNRFFLRGRILVGGDTPWSFIFSWFIILLIAATWFAETVPWWWHHITPAIGIIGAYLCAIVISCMVVTVRKTLVFDHHIDLKRTYRHSRIPVYFPEVSILNPRYLPEKQRFRTLLCLAT